jgi:hypothetical protein
VVIAALLVFDQPTKLGSNSGSTVKLARKFAAAVNQWS